MSGNIKTISIKNAINNEYEEKFIGVDAERVDCGESTLNEKLNNIDSQFNYDEGSSNSPHNDSRNMDESSENVIKRHFDKFKK